MSESASEALPVLGAGLVFKDQPAASANEKTGPGSSAERWLPVVGWPAYEVSDRGRVRRVTPGRGTYVGHILTPQPIGRPWAKYPAVHLSGGSRVARRYFTVHALVARAFLGEPPPGYEVDHINRDKSDARLVNLEYVTRGENRRRRGNGTCRRCGGPHTYCGTRAERARLASRPSAPSVQP